MILCNLITYITITKLCIKLIVIRLLTRVINIHHIPTAITIIRPHVQVFKNHRATGPSEVRQ